MGREHVMVRMLRKAQVDSSDVARVREWIQRYTSYMAERAPGGGAVTSWMEAYGTYGIVYWMIDAPDLGSLDSFLEQLPTEDGYRDILKAGSELFVSGQTSDVLLKQV
jgi:hypothetical protein